MYWLSYCVYWTDIRWVTVVVNTPEQVYSIATISLLFTKFNRERFIVDFPLIYRCGKNKIQIRFWEWHETRIPRMNLLQVNSSEFKLIRHVHLKSINGWKVQFSSWSELEWVLWSMLFEFYGLRMPPTNKWHLMLVVTNEPGFQWTIFTIQCNIYPRIGSENSVLKLLSKDYLLLGMKE